MLNNSADTGKLSSERRRTGPRFTGSDPMSCFEFSQDLFCVCHGEIIQDINSAGIALLGGQSADDFRGKPFDQLISPTYAVGFDGLVETMRDEREALRIQLIGLDGGKHDVDLRFHRAREIQEDAVIVSGNDISAHNRAVAKLFELINDLEAQTVRLRAARDEARVADRAKTEFLAAMSHELRTPLNAIIGFSEMFTGEIFGPLGNQKYDEYAANICSSGSHLLSVITDILDISRIERGQLDLNEEEVLLATIISSSVTLVRERAENNKLSLDINVEDSDTIIKVDERRMKQILVNLLSNAIKFTPKGGTVTLHTKINDDGSLRISIADDGIGMSSEAVAIAVTNFGQVDSSLARKYEGTGLGLPLSRAMVEMHGGRLSIESAEGDGTTVQIILPAERIAG